MDASRHINGGCGDAGAHQLAQGKACGDQFVVEDLLDFSSVEEDNAGVMGGVAAADTRSEAAEGNTASNSSTATAVDSYSNSFSGGPNTHFADGGFNGDLCEPYEELKELEWLSNFVEESFSSEDLHKQQLLSLTKSNSSSSETNSAFTTAADEQHPFSTEAAVPGKARSKRSHSSPCIWWSRHLPTTSSSSSESVAAALERSSCKKPAKKKAPSLAVANGRKCLHCATDKTPQWRAGPMGPKTLCNACGVRYKSGRLVPEYRPAASPTFVLSKHSNSHRKVVELRRQKEIQQQFLHAGGGGFYDVALAAAAAVSVGDEFLIHDRLGAEFLNLT